MIFAMAILSQNHREINTAESILARKIVITVGDIPMTSSTI